MNDSRLCRPCRRLTRNRSRPSRRADGGGCQKPLLVGCGVLALLLGIAAVVFVVKAKDVLAYAINQLRTEVMAHLPEDAPADRPKSRGRLRRGPRPHAQRRARSGVAAGAAEEAHRCGLGRFDPKPDSRGARRSDRRAGQVQSAVGRRASRRPAGVPARERWPGRGLRPRRAARRRPARRRSRGRRRLEPLRARLARSLPRATSRRRSNSSPSASSAARRSRSCSGSPAPARRSRSPRSSSA